MYGSAQFHKPTRNNCLSAKWHLPLKLKRFSSIWYNFHQFSLFLVLIFRILVLSVLHVSRINETGCEFHSKSIGSEYEVRLTIRNRGSKSRFFRRVPYNNKQVCPLFTVKFDGFENRLCLTVKKYPKKWE